MSALADVWVPDTTVAMLDRAVRERPDTTALICGDEALNYREYGAAVAAMAASLGDVAGQHVVLLLRNGIDICVATFAVQAAGATSVALNPDYTPNELAPMFADARPVVTVTHDDLVSKLEGLGAGVIIQPFFERQREAPSSAARSAALAGLADARRGLSLALEDGRSDHPALVQFTGGTTGRPKGVVLTHRAIATNVAQREAVLPTVFGNERVLCMMPLFHSFAVAMGLHLAAYAAGTLVILPRYRPDWVIDAIAKHRITRLPAGPTVFASLLNYDGLTREAVASLRCAYSGSAPLPLDTLTRWEALTGVPIYEGYGQSEAGPILTYHGPGMALKRASVGPPLPGTEIEVVGGAEVGELRARGPQIMSHYLDQPDATARALIRGWLHTGDIGRIDADGYVFIEDRAKDMAIVGGYNVYPREIDEVLAAQPAIVEAAAIGVPDAYRGEVIWAYVVGNIDEVGVREACAAALVAYKHPSVVRFVDALPRTPVGKIDKQALKAMAAAELAGMRDVA